MSDGTRAVLSAILGSLATAAAIVLYFRFVVRPDVVRAARRLSTQLDNPPPGAFPFVEDAKGDLWESVGGGVWVCQGEAHADPLKPKGPVWLPWRDLVKWHGPVTWLRADEVAARRKSA